MMMTYGYAQGVSKFSNDLTTNFWNASTVINITVINITEFVEITDTEYKLVKDKPQIHWFCPPCNTKVMKNLKKAAR